MVKCLWSIVFILIFLHEIQPIPFSKHNSDIKDLVAAKTLKTCFFHRLSLFSLFQLFIEKSFTRSDGRNVRFPLKRDAN